MEQEAGVATQRSGTALGAAGANVYLRQAWQFPRGFWGRNSSETLPGVQPLDPAISKRLRRRRGQTSLNLNGAFTNSIVQLGDLNLPIPVFSGMFLDARA